MKKTYVIIGSVDSDGTIRVKLKEVVRGDLSFSEQCRHYRINDNPNNAILMFESSDVNVLSREIILAHDEIFIEEVINKENSDTDNEDIFLG